MSPSGEKSDYIVTDLEEMGLTSWKCVQLLLRNSRINTGKGSEFPKVEIKNRNRTVSSMILLGVTVNYVYYVVSY